ncbi:MAG: alpha/beta hydrolase [Rhodoferax sp.]|nr:alpha/beta hydrolase [Rhodoferax sp.]
MATSRDPAWYDAQYNNTARVSDSAMLVEGWKERSAQARAALQGHLDVAYGEEPGDRLDIFPAANPNAPVFVFIHGGYWRALDKADQSFIAAPFVKAGACVVVPNYDLCPGAPDRVVTVPLIVLQMVRALSWVWRNIAQYGGNPSRITVAGHSAGGHLATMMLSCNWQSHDKELPVDLVRNALSISGLYELESIMRTPFLQSVLQLNPAQVRKASPAWHVRPRSGRLTAVVGGAESFEFQRQNKLIQTSWGSGVVAVCEVLPELNHFTILDALAQPNTRLHDLALALLGFD